MSRTATMMGSASVRTSQSGLTSTKRTIWSWPIGPFLEAYLRVNDRSEPSVKQAREWLAPLLRHMDDDACIGQISEIFEAEPPHRPVGCFAQAWSVAEALRLAVQWGL